MESLLLTDGGRREFLRGLIRMDGYEIGVRVELPPTFPLCLAKVFIDSISPRVERRPHILTDGRLCIEAESDLLLDVHDPWGILRETLVRAHRLLHQILTGDRAAEFARELISYWKGSPRGLPVPCFVAPDDRPRLTKALYFEELLLAVADDPREPARFSPDFSRLPPCTLRNAIYIPIDPLAGDPAFHPDKLATLSELRKYVRALPSRDGRVLDKLLGRSGKHSPLVILGVRRPEGERALVGIQFHDTRGGHPLAHEGNGGSVEKIELQRRDAPFLASRGGADPHLRGRKVLLAGCGAVGGYLAMALARAGVGSLTLVDGDVFELANTYRHVCGIARNGMPKVFGLRQEIERLVPYITVSPYQQRLEAFLHERPQTLDSHDLVIAALGNPTIELELNRRIWSSHRNAPALFCWLEPLGLGGHALLTHGRASQSPARGCLECLYDHPVRGAALENLAAFAKPGEAYTRDSFGCGGRYLPFGDLDAQNTAQLTARLALRVLRGEVEGAPLQSWKGDARAFLQAGYEVTSRYESQTGAFAETLAYIRPDCAVCQT
ncbi:ThiF family adenylyltransferase [Cystobacter fuscus]|nr:ThiF family adenylyltransferase [Cystobacter fuscus]